MTGRAQLERVEAELTDARRRLHALAGPLAADRWGARPSAEDWSVAECVIHLNLTSQAMLPLVRAAITRGREANQRSAGPYRRDLVGWFLCWAAERPARIRVKTAAPFVPAAVEPKETALATFDGLQDQVVAALRDADGLDLRRLRITSPFAARMRYNLYSCFRLIAVHQRHHLWQAEAALRRLRAAD